MISNSFTSGECNLFCYFKTNPKENGCYELFVSVSLTFIKNIIMIIIHNSCINILYLKTTSLHKA